MPSKHQLPCHVTDFAHWRKTTALISANGCIVRVRDVNAVWSASAWSSDLYCWAPGRVVGPTSSCRCQTSV
ncbi:hypothetical protein GA0115240_135291 [Streptomyces sp. DvalAA-14]|nr:hypothetical protein GA0115240_135291 [Streptomyces sp. DvalAA-14]